MSRGDLSSRFNRGWASYRYNRLLPWAGRSRLSGVAYSEIVAQVEVRRDLQRRDVAVNRIARARRISERAASRIYHASLRSEAQEEADSVRFMRDGDAFERWLPEEAPPFGDEPVLYATLHFGSPVLAFLYLRSRGNDVRALIRGLDDENPMLDPKRRWGARKVAWVRELARGGIVGADTAAVGAAREHLLDGKSVFAAVDIPGDVVSRTSKIDFYGEQLVFSAGIVRLAALTRSRVVPMVALGGGRRMRAHFGRPIDPNACADPMGAVFAELGQFIDRYPGEWWMWPFVRPA